MQFHAYKDFETISALTGMSAGESAAFVGCDDVFLAVLVDDIFGRVGASAGAATVIRVELLVAP